MMPYIDHPIAPGVTHIEEAPMGVCFTLLEGRDRALLVDTGYGLEDTAAHVRALLPQGKPLQVVLTHAHHDHALGALHFPSVWLLPAEEENLRVYSNEKWRRHVLAGARSHGLTPEEAAFLAAPLPARSAPPASVDLGGLTAELIPLPGHTPGSLVVWVPELALLLTGDDWNPCTWLFFPEALPVEQYRENIRQLPALPFRQVLCSHRTGAYPREALVSFIEGLTDPVLQAAEPSPEGAPHGVTTCTAHPCPGQVLVFDRHKYIQEA